MFPESSTAIRIKFLEGLNESLREQVALQQKPSRRTARGPVLLFSSLVSLMTWLVG